MGFMAAIKEKLGIGTPTDALSAQQRRDLEIMEAKERLLKSKKPGAVKADAVLLEEGAAAKGRNARIKALSGDE